MTREDFPFHISDLSSFIRVLRRLAKNLAVPIGSIILVLAAGMLLAVSACHGGWQKNAKADHRKAPVYDVYLPPTKLADLEDRAIYGSSGLIASRTSPGNYWTR